MDNLEKMIGAGLSSAEIDICAARFKESGFASYDTWVTAYIALNTTKKVDGSGNLVIDTRQKKKPLFTVSKNKYRA